MFNYLYLDSGSSAYLIDKFDFPNRKKDNWRILDIYNL